MLDTCSIIHTQLESNKKWWGSLRISGWILRDSRESGWDPIRIQSCIRKTRVIRVLKFLKMITYYIESTSKELSYSSIRVLLAPLDPEFDPGGGASQSQLCVWITFAILIQFANKKRRIAGLNASIQNPSSNRVYLSDWWSCIAFGAISTPESKSNSQSFRSPNKWRIIT